jgi:arylsulfatase A-like enzyme
MVENIDNNLGKLFKNLDQLGLTENILIIFMTDNGPQHGRYVPKREITAVRDLQSRTQIDGFATQIIPFFPNESSGQISNPQFKILYTANTHHPLSPRGAFCSLRGY